MKDIVGTPGTRSGLALRMSQAVCAGGSLIAMCSAYGFSNYSAFCYLTLAMVVQFLWSFILVCVDIRSLKNNWDLDTSEHAWKYVVGDWLFGLTSAAAASSSAGLAILLERDVHFCRSYPYLSCSRYKVSVILAFMAWSFIAASATSTFWLMVKLA